MFLRKKEHVNRIDKRPDKFFGYLQLIEAFGKEGCPICRRMEEVTHNYVNNLLYENVTDGDTRNKLKNSHGFCSRHSEILYEIRDPLGTSIIYHDLLKMFVENLKTNNLLNLKEKAACPLCQMEKIQIESDIKLFLNFLDDEHFKSAFENSDALCANHLIKVLQKINDKSKKDLLVTIQISKLNKLLENLDRFIQKNDYRFQGDKFTENETNAWRKAVEFISR